MGSLADQALPSQIVTGILSMILSSIAMIIAFYWGSKPNPKHNGWLNGLDDNCTRHAVLMVLGMCFCYTQALVSFRVLHFLGHIAAKVIHGIWHTCNIGFVAGGLYCIIKFHNMKYWGHLSSIHSWMGLILLVFYFQNWVLGGSIFGVARSFFSGQFKASYLSYHRYFGIVGLLLASVTMLTGIEQKAWLE